MRILAIETSCDETAIAIAEFTGPKSRPVIDILSNMVSSQVKLHERFGGVVPNLAKREHQRNLVPIFLTALKEARLLKFKAPANGEARQRRQGSRQRRGSQWAAKFKVTNDGLKNILEREPELLRQFAQKILPLSPPKVDAIAVTIGPGLAPTLWVGVNFTRTLAYIWRKPLIPVNHMEGHIYSSLLQNTKRLIGPSRQALGKALASLKLWRSGQIIKPRFPALALLISGGHTELVLVKGCGKYKIIGETLDDAAGEAFDKVARLLGLPYPGGPPISAAAEMGLKVKSSKLKVKLPRPMINSKDYNFSFSGLKTAVFYLVRDLTKKYPLTKIRPIVAKEFQNAVVEVLIKKTILAAKEYKVKTILLGGGVAANKLLREQLAEETRRLIPNCKILIPNLSLTGDNALMIALAAYFAGKKIAWRNVHADANAKLS